MSTALSASSKTESQFAEDVRAGLTRAGQKTLPCQYFYDDVGSALFQAISMLPEYGLTRADARLICAHAAEIVAVMPSPLWVVELGSGDGGKTRRILEVLAARERAVYFPIDVSASALSVCQRELGSLGAVDPVQATYLDGLSRVAGQRGHERILLLFLGSTIGNFDRAEARHFLAELRQRLREGDALLLGTDLVKPLGPMLRAYDDDAGVTAAFNRNLLARINRELGADFDPRRFDHVPRYDHAERRIEMHLRSRAKQQVYIPAAGLTVPLARGETIWTESSHKFHPEEVREMASGAGFHCEHQWIDQEWPFAETLATI